MTLTRLLLAVLLLPTLAASQSPIWSNRGPSPHPDISSGRDLGMCYDVAAKQTLLSGSNRSETWAWDGKTWTRLSTSGPTSSFRRLVYDARRQRAVMVTSGQETWEWNGTSWSLIAAAGTPRVGSGFQMAYDSKRGVTVLFGGAYGGRTHAETWNNDGSVWKQRSSGGPPHRMNHTMAFDESRGEVLVFGGTGIRNSNDAYYADTWVWNGSYWREHFGISNPAHRQWASMSYDPVREVAILYGGYDVRGGVRYDDTWEWDGSGWKVVATRGQPQLSYTTRMAFDAGRSVAVLVGEDQGMDQTWEYQNSGTITATFASFGTGCPSSVGTPVMMARTGSLPRLGKSFELDFGNLPKTAFARVMGIAGASKTQWGTFPLPLELGLIGMPGCRLYCAMDFPLVNLPITSGTAVWTLQVPNDARLSGGVFYVQGVVLEPGVNRFGAVMTNAGEGRMGN